MCDISKRKSPHSPIEQVTSGNTPPMTQFQPSPQEMADLLSQRQFGLRILALFLHRRRLKSGLTLQSPPARTNNSVRAGGLCITSRDFQSLGSSYPELRLTNNNPKSKIPYPMPSLEMMCGIIRQCRPVILDVSPRTIIPAAAPSIAQLPIT
jgi:hypothetical protein